MIEPTTTHESTAMGTNEAPRAVPGLRNFEARPMRDGSINFSGTAKIGGQVYFAGLKVTLREDGSPKIGLGDHRFETMTGKPVRGIANVTLEGIMGDAIEAALEWARARHPDNGTAALAPSLENRRRAIPR